MRTRALLLSGIVLAGGLLAAPSSAEEVSRLTNGCVDSVPETDLGAAPGATPICYSLYRPETATAESPVPVVLHSHGWGGSRTNDANAFRSWTDAGYGVLSFDQRGFGQSGGRAHVEDPAFEGQDVKRIVDLVASLDWVQKETRTVTEVVGGKGKKAKGGTVTTREVVDPTDPVLGAMGGSYGGGYQFVGAFTELAESGRTRFDALAPEITWFDLGESLAPQDVVRTAWVSALYAAGLPSDAHTTTVHRGFAEGSATGQWPREMAEFFADNGPAHHVANDLRLDLPTLFRQGATDNLFPLDQALKNFDQALTAEARANSILVGYNGGHALPSAVPAGSGTAGDPCTARLAPAKADGRPGSFDDLTRAFFDEHLKGGARTLEGYGEYHLATAQGDRCVTVGSVEANTSYELGTLATPTAAGAPVAHELAAGPLTVAGTPTLDALVTAAGVDTRAFFALSVGTSPATARVVQNNTLPLRELLPVVRGARTVELPSVAVDVPAGQKLFLTVSPVADMFAAHGSRAPGAFLLEDVTVSVPVVAQP